MPSAEHLCKQFRPRSGLTECQAKSGSKLFDTLIVFLKEFFKKVNFENIKSAYCKNRIKFPACKKFVGFSIHLNTIKIYKFFNYGILFFCWIWFFMSQSIIFQLCWDGSSWVEPVLSTCTKLGLICLAQGPGEAPTRSPSVSSKALYHLATVLP